MKIDLHISDRGGQKIYVRIPDNIVSGGRQRPVAFFTHGLGSSTMNRQSQAVVFGLERQGIDVIEVNTTNSL